MQDYSTPEPYFPENLEDYAPWVAKHGLLAPYGECQCGCGEKTAIVTNTNFNRGWKSDEPTRFVRGHNARLPRSFWQDRFWAKVDKGALNECWEWQAYRDVSGYGSMRIDGRMDKAHRISWRISKGPIPIDKHVCHKCDNPSCCNPYHLFLGTQVTNNKDRDAKKRHAHGKSHPRAKLTEDDVRRIRQLAAQGYSAKELAKKYPVNLSSIRHIISRRKWKHVE